MVDDGDSVDCGGQAPPGAGTLLDGLSADRRALLTMELARRMTGTGPVRLPREGERPRFPASYAQERLWFLDQADPGTTAYVMPGALRLRGELDKQALSRALDEIVRRHEVLRTTFANAAGGTEQVIGPARPVPMPVVDVADEDAVAAQCTTEANTPFDLSADLLLRARLLRLASDHHVLVIALHHIAADGWSLGVLTRELGELYGAFRDGRDPELPELGVQYADYAQWQRKWLAGGPMDAQLAYWRQRLAGAAVMELPADLAPAASRSWRGKSVSVPFPAGLWDEVTAFAAAHEVTPYMVVVAVLAAVLSRWSGQHDVVIGSPLAGRARPEAEPLIGFFVNTLPLRVDVAGAPPFLELLTRVRGTCVEAYAHQDVPFERLVRDLRPDRSIGPVPLVQVMLALRDTPAPAPALPGLEVHELDLAVSQGASKFDLVLDLVPGPDGTMSCRAEFSTDLFEETTALRIGTAFTTLLAAALRDPAERADRLPLLTASERRYLVEELSGSGSASAADAAGCLHTLIDLQAKVHPDNPAVECGATVLSYRQLVESANRLARRLRALGAGPEQLVGVCLPRSAGMVTALLAILKAGAAYVPLDPGYPRRRIEQMARDSLVSLVITTRKVAATGLLDLPGADGLPSLTILCLEDAVDDRGDSPPEYPPRPRSLAYVIYTSGSSGVPKGSANEHGGVVNTLAGLNQVLGLTATDRMLAVSSLNYDMSVYEIFGSLLAGACVVVPPADIEVTDPMRLGRLAAESGVTAWSSAPAILELLVNYAHEHGGLAGSQLRLAVLGGDKLPPALAERLTDMLPELRLYNLAGMTEVSYCSTYHRVRRPEPVPGNIPWGRPLPNQRLYVLDSHGEPAPVGVPGELYIGGAGVRRGYWRRPRLTAERFVPDHVGRDPSGRLYRTGDGARWRAHGELEFLGRLDHQVKIRGLRIEPGEIEAALTAHPGIERAIVLPHGDDRGQRLVAYVIPGLGLPPSVSDLRRHLLDQVPDYMVPSAFVLLEQFPLMPSGKLDRAALPAPEPARPELAQAFVEPTQPLEQVLAAIVAEVLQLDRVGATDDFFDLGGHSLLVTQVVSRIRDLFRVDFSIRTFLAGGNVLAVASQLRAASAAAGLDADRIAELVLQVAGMDEAQVAGRLSE